jgi:hypothetical protein
MMARTATAVPSPACSWPSGAIGRASSPSSGRSPASDAGQTGDREMRALAPVEALEQVAGVIQARRRRPPTSAAHLQKVA